MKDVNFTQGSIVSYNGENWRVSATVNLDLVELENADRTTRRLVKVREVRPQIVESGSAVQRRLPLGDTREREIAILRMECIRPLLTAPAPTKAAVQERARQYGMSIATVYRLIRTWEQNGRLDALVKGKSDGGRGKGRLSPKVEEVIRNVLPIYLNLQKFSIKDVAGVVRQVCESQGLPAPHLNTVSNRIHQFSDQLVAKKRLGKAAAARYEAHPDSFDLPTYPLAVVEVDHTVLDGILVDEEYRLPIGRAVWITLALDVYSRMVVGYYVSLDPVGSMSTGMCIANALMVKDEWLRQHGIETDWPCWGPMDCIHVDNAKEFRGKMLRRACERYGIELNFRPVGRPHFGGHIERFFGTLSKQIHKLPGTTFSNIREKAEYDSEGKACFTFPELDSFIAKWIIEVYHQSYHRGIQTTPLRRFREGFNGPMKRLPPRIIGDIERLQRDFMPFVERTIQPAGVEIDHVRYSGSELSKWINSREEGTKRARKFIFARDPRDISRVFFFDPDVNDYKPIYRTDNSKAAASVWELKKANHELEMEGRRYINESLIFKKVVELREQAIGARKKTKAARRKVEKLKRHQQLRNDIRQDENANGADQIDEEEFTRPIRPFDDSPVTPFQEIEKL